jgi:hypothetical protein
MSELFDKINRALFRFRTVISVGAMRDEIMGLSVRHFHQFPFLLAHDVRAHLLDRVSLNCTEEKFNAVTLSPVKAEVVRLA